MIYVECYPDKALVSSFGIPKRKIKHAYAKGNVCNRLEKSKSSKGLVDEDPLSAQPTYIKKLKLLSDEHEIKLLYDEKKQNHLIVLCPRLEEWILKAAKEAKVDVGNYGLPDDADELHKIISAKPRKPRRFENLIADIKKRSRMLKTLEGFIKR